LLLLVSLLTSTALLVIGAAGAKPPAGAKPAKVPPPGAPPFAVKGTPGTITITHYTPDGLTVLGVERVRASASDTSASIAARLGKAAPEVVKTGAVTDWDDAGRPGAPVKQVEANPTERTTASAKRAAVAKGLARKADCCSSSGCDAVDVSRDITGDIFGSWSPLGTFHHRVYWCWSYPRITGVNVSCWSDVDGSFIDNHGCDGWGHYYTWHGSGHGGHYSFRQGDWSNCVFFVGCFGNIYPWIEIWVNGNGAWAQEQGG
jgi:hypothetical protein